MSSVPFTLLNDLEAGEKDIEGDFCYRNNVHQANVKIRLAFIRKVYGLLSIQLLITTWFGFMVMFWPKVRFFIHNNDWLLSLSFFLNVVILIALNIKRKDHPTNLILLGLFTLVEAYTVAVFVTFFEQFVVLQALVLTVAVVLGLTFFTFQSKRDFSFLGTFLYSALVVLLVGALMQLFFGSTTLELCMSIGGSLLFSLFIVYDTQNIMKRVSPEEYISATIELYLDIINLFISLVRALQAARKN